MKRRDYAQKSPPRPAGQDRRKRSGRRGAESSFPSPKGGQGTAHPRSAPSSPVTTGARRGEGGKAAETPPPSGEGNCGSPPGGAHEPRQAWPTPTGHAQRREARGGGRGPVPQPYLQHRRITRSVVFTPQPAGRRLRRLGRRAAGVAAWGFFPPPPPPPPFSAPHPADRPHWESTRSRLPLPPPTSRPPRSCLRRCPSRPGRGRPASSAERKQSRWRHHRRHRRHLVGEKRREGPSSPPPSLFHCASRHWLSRAGIFFSIGQVTSALLLGRLASSLLSTASDWLLWRLSSAVVTPHDVTETEIGLQGPRALSGRLSQCKRRTLCASFKAGKRQF